MSLSVNPISQLVQKIDAETQAALDVAEAAFNAPKIEISLKRQDLIQQ